MMLNPLNVYFVFKQLLQYVYILHLQCCLVVPFTFDARYGNWKHV